MYAGCQVCYQGCNYIKRRGSKSSSNPFRFEGSSSISLFLHHFLNTITSSYYLASTYKTPSNYPQNAFQLPTQHLSTTDKTPSKFTTMSGSAVNIVKYYFHRKPTNPERMAQLVSLAYQTATDRQIYPKAIFIRYVLLLIIPLTNTFGTISSSHTE